MVIVARSVLQSARVSSNQHVPFVSSAKSREVSFISRVRAHELSLTNNIEST